jgi:putative ABC transport system permease protein
MGIAPTLRSARLDLATVLRERSSARAGGRARRMLVFAQVALSTVLLTGTGLLLGSFVRLTRVDAGFDPTGVLTLQVMAGRAGYTSGLPVVDAFSHTLDALRAIPGVSAVGATMAAPLSGGPNQSGVRFPTSPTNTGDQEHDFVLGDVAPITPGYLRAAGIPLLGGEDLTITARDSVSAKVTLIDDVLAGRYFPKGNAVGQPILIDGDTLRVLGVVKHVRMYNLHEEGRGQVWVSHLYFPVRSMTVLMRVSGDPMKYLEAARRVIRVTEHGQTISDVAPLSNSVRNALSERLLVLTLVGAFAAAALLLAALGVYGVTASAVTQRTHELGIRMALGADRRSVVASVLAEPARLVALGLLVGLGGAFVAARAARGLLYGVSESDPLTVGGVCVVLLAIAVLASYFPARRATRVDPMTALRSE